MVQDDAVLQKSMMTLLPSSNVKLDSGLIGEDLTSDSETSSIQPPGISQSRENRLEGGVVVQADAVPQKSMMTLSPSSSAQLDNGLIGEDLTSDSATSPIQQPGLSQSRKEIVLTRHQLQSLLLGRPELSRLFQHPSGPKPGC